MLLLPRRRSVAVVVALMAGLALVAASTLVWRMSAVALRPATNDPQALRAPSDGRRETQGGEAGNGATAGMGGADDDDDDATDDGMNGRKETGAVHPSGADAARRTLSRKKKNLAVMDPALEGYASVAPMPRLATIKANLTRAPWSHPERYYAPYCQDELLRRSLFVNLRGGVFVDASVGDGRTGSRSLHFERYRGWQGIGFERSPDSWEAASDLRAIPILHGLLCPVSGTFTVVTEALNRTAPKKADDGDPAPRQRLVPADSEAVAGLGTSDVSEPLRCYGFNELVAAVNMTHVDALFLGMGGDGALDFSLLAAIDFSLVTIDAVLVPASPHVRRIHRFLLDTAGFHLRAVFGGVDWVYTRVGATLDAYDVPSTEAEYMRPYCRQVALPAALRNGPILVGPAPPSTPAPITTTTPTTTTTTTSTTTTSTTTSTPAPLSADTGVVPELPHTTPRMQRDNPAAPIDAEASTVDADAEPEKVERRDREGNGDSGNEGTQESKAAKRWWDP